MSGFFLGMIMATVVIAGVLFFLNTNKTTFQQHEAKPQPREPEIMRPEGSQQVAPPPVAIRPEDSTEGTSPSDEVKLPKPVESAEKTDDTQPEDKKAEDKPADKTAPPVADKGQTDKPADKPATPPKTVEKQPKPGPEQILESGSLEKAEQAAKDKAAAKAKEEAQRAQTAKEKAAKEKAAKETQNKTAQAQNKAAAGGKARLQVGSFKDGAAADAQRAKLAMLGVSTNVVKSTGANGQTVYRVQTGSMSRQQAEQTAQRLKQNQIDSLVRAAE